MNVPHRHLARPPTLRMGIVALTKSLLLVLGVPGAVYRLFTLAEGKGESARSLIIDLLLLGVALCWAHAVKNLISEIRRALRSPDDHVQSSWSSSWAAGIVGLLIVAGALSVHSGDPQRSTPITQSPAGNRFDALHDGSPREPHRPTLYGELIGGIGSLIMAALLRRTRLLARLRTSLRPPHAHTLALHDDLQHLLSTMDCSTSETMLDWIEATNRFLGARFIGRQKEEVPEIALMRVGGEGVELLLQRPIEYAPLPFRATQQGWWWRLDPSCDLVSLNERSGYSPRLAPWLMPVGHDGCGEILVALGPGRALGLVGACDAVDDTMRALVTGLRVLPWCDELTIELCGLEAPPLFEQTMHMQSSSVQTLSDLYGLSRTARDSMQDEWRREPLVVIHRQAITNTTRSLLVAIKDNVGALVGEQMPIINLRLDYEHARLEPFGIELDAHLLSAENGLIVDRLLSAYAQPNEIVDVARNLPDDGTRMPVEGACELCILGPTIELRGAQHQPHSDDVGRIHELIVYLSLHNYQASIAQLLNALFIGADPRFARTRLENLIAMSRAMLGRSTDGNERVRRSESEMVVLDGSVTLDWHRVQRAIIEAQSLGGGAAIRVLQDALTHCTYDRLLDGMTNYPWFHATRYDEFIISSLIDACHHLATLTNVPGSRETARWAIELGQRIEPASEIMTRDLMVLLDAEGRGTEIIAAYTELQRELAALGGAEPSAVTQQLYLALTAHERAT